MRVPLPTSKRRVRIEIIPLIDIVFFLLATFVMVSMSMVKNQGISVNLPTAATGHAQDNERLVTITVTEKDAIYLDKESMSLPQMSARLAELKRVDPQLKVLINGDQKAAFGRAVGVLDEVRRLGINKVAIRTKGASGA